MAIKPLLVTQDGLISDTTRWAEKRGDVIRRLLETLGQSQAPRNTGQLEVTSEEELAKYFRRKVWFSTGNTDRIPAWLLEPKGVAFPAPAILACHQTNDCGKDEAVGLGGSAHYAYGQELAERGYVVLAPDVLTVGERIYPGFQQWDSVPFYAEYPHWSIIGKNLEDSRAALDVLCGLDFVDPERIGVIGHSLGGHNAIFVAAMDERVHACVSNCGMSVFSEEEERLEWTLEDGYIFLPSLRFYFLNDRPPPFDLHEVAALIAPRPWLNISAYVDEAYGRQEFLAQTGVLLHQIYELYQRTSAFAWQMHGGNHSFPPYIRAGAYAWLDRWLKG